MLLIECPWCGPRERDRVLLRRRGAHRAARRHRRADRRAMGRLPVHAQEPARARTSSSGCTRTAAGAGSTCARDTVTYRDHRRVQGRRGAAGSGAVHARMSAEPDRSARRRPHRPPHAARVHVQRQALRGPRRRHARLRAARQRRARGRAQLEVPPAARHRRLRASEEPNAIVQLETGAAHGAERARDRGGARTTASSASSVNAWPSVDFDVMAVNGLLRALHAGRLLLQDVHVAASRSG